jgi:hypothetical protein
MRKYPDYHTSYDKLRTAVKEAWDVIKADELQSLVREMTARCQAVIDADGEHKVLAIARIEDIECAGNPCRWRPTNENYP